MLCLWIVRLADDEKISGNLSPVQQDSQNPFMLLSMLPTMLPKLGQSRVPPLTAGLQFQVSGSLRASLHFSSLQPVRRSIQNLSVVFFSDIDRSPIQETLIIHV